MPSLGVRPSVTFVSCAKTNKDIFEIFSPSDSQAIIVFPYQTGWRCSDGKFGTPLTGASNARGLWENDDFQPLSRSIWETVIVRWAHSGRQFVSIEFSFHPYNMLRDCARGVPRGNKNVVKIAIFGLTHWLKHRITRTLLKIDRYMLRGVWRALNCLSIRATYCAIIEGASPGGNKNVGCTWKQRFFALAVRITGKLLQIDGYMLRGVWQALNWLFIYATFCVIATRASPGKNINCGNLIIHNVAGLLEPTVVSNRQACSLLKNINLSRLQV